MEHIVNEGNAGIVLAVCDAIHENAAYLSEIDGATGDGDHGVNMNKGFLMAKERIDGGMSLSKALLTVSRTLVEDIGGSMGPIYGTMFRALSKEGDKTLIDTAAPASRAFDAALAEGEGLAGCLDAMAAGAEAGLESTRDMVAKIGRAARLGERSRGHLDAGAASCCIILKTLAEGMKARIEE